MKAYLYSIWIVMFLLIFSIYSLAPCRDVQLDNYKYSLSSLSQITTNNLVDNLYVEMSFCTLRQCAVSDCNGYVLVKNTTDGTWQSYTSNQTGPLQEQYWLIDPKKPDQGIAFAYVPAFKKSINTTNVTIENITQESIVQSQYTSRTQIQVFCSTQRRDPACSHTMTNQSASANSTYQLIRYNRKLVCSLYHSSGCPQLAVNSFWQFLRDNMIAFAIIIWVCALYLLVFGYLAIRMTILLYGTFTGAFFGVLLVAESYQNFYLESNGIFVFTVCLSVVLGLLFGIVLLTIPKLGYVNIGIFVAAIFSLLLQNSFLYLTGSLLAFYITFGSTALVMTLIALMELRYFVIMCSSFTGAFFFIRPLGFFLPGYPNQLISGKNFLISVRTPWQFYLYLGSILILTALGIIIQRFINKKIGHKKGGASGNYYLEQDGTIREKLKRIFEFKQIKDMVKAGKKQILQLKKIISEKDKVNFSPAQFGQDEDDQGHYIQMEKMQKIQQTERKSKQKQKEKIKFISPQPRPPKQKQARGRSSQQVDPIEIQAEDLEQIRDSDSVAQIPKKKKKNKNK